ncbi:MAG: sugar phosphate isomerase/epimerase [Actinomycetota bacterium]|nr:sugar phosphate isomerase/epimerase [Actinomycetota bacterium]
MKLGMMANCFSDKTLEEVCIIAREEGLQAIELAAGCYVGKAHCNPEILLGDKGALEKFNKTISSYKLELSSLSCHGNPVHPDKRIADKHTADLKAALELAGKLGVKVVTTLAGCPGAADDEKYPNWITCPTHFEELVKWQWEEKILPFWNEMIKVAKKFNVRFGFEMAPGDVVYNPELLLKLREKVGAEEISCNFDPSHLFWQGIDPLKVIRRLGNAIVHVHAKDCRIDSAVAEWRGVLDWKNFDDVSNRAWYFSTCGYGHDVLFWKDFMSNLRLIGYDGVISVEQEDPTMSINEGLKKSISFLKNILFYEES